MTLSIRVEVAIRYLCSPAGGTLYGYIVAALERVYTRQVPTFAVAVEDSRYVLYMNPDFGEPQSPARLFMLMEHEIAHIILLHHARAADAWRLCADNTARAYFRVASPLAMDMAVNDLIRNNHPAHVLRPVVPPGVPEGPEHSPAIMPEDYGLPPGKSYEEYLLLLVTELRARVPEPGALLREAIAGLTIPDGTTAAPGSMYESLVPVPGEAGSSDGNADAPTHDVADALRNQLLRDLHTALTQHLPAHLTNCSDPGESTQISHAAQRLVRNAVESYKKQRGTLPGHWLEVVNALLRPPTIPWSRVLRSLLAAEYRVVPARSTSRISMLRAAQVRALNLRNRRHIGRRMSLTPGTDRDTDYVIYFALDTSASQAASDLELALAELRHLQTSSAHIRIHVMYVDVSIQKTYELTPQSKIDYVVAGRGGTTFEAVFEHIKKNNVRCDLLVYCTDGEAPAPTTPIPCKTIWLLRAGSRPVFTNHPRHLTVFMREYPA